MKDTNTSATKPAGTDPSRTSTGSKALARSRSFLRTQYWIWPLVAAVILVFVGVYVRRQMEAAMKTLIAANLQTILNANTEALRAWAATVRSRAEAVSEDARVADLVSGIVQRAKAPDASRAALLAAPQLAQLRTLLQPELEHYGFTGYVVLDSEFTVVAAANEELVGLKSPPGYAEELKRCLQGEILVTPPFPSVAPLLDERGNLRANVPTMLAAAPVQAADGKVIALLCLRIPPEKDFTRILATARAGETGETYAFGRTGLLMSESRFDDDLKRLGLIPDTPESHSILTLELRNPSVDLTQGKPAPQRRSSQPLTHPVTVAITGQEGVDVAGYRDYLGVPTVGAWRWLPDLDMGLITEMDLAEATKPLHILRLSFGFIFALLVVAAVGVFLLMRLARRLQESAHKAALKAMQLGQYALDEELGTGGFGTVYRGHHALMRRPVAVKLLDPLMANEHSIARFEREVQLTCTLTHPNTIALYDYGRTPEGLFYYAMEYLEGLALDKLVQDFGRQPEGRVIYILRQVCGSLAEAHAQGLVHRDIKPANIYLTQRGGIPDFVKVLDFGLVKARKLEGQVELTGATATLGTPLYMSPEAVEHPDRVDARADLYSLGCVGYYLLTGETVFSGLTVGEIMVQQIRSVPEKPSARLRQPVSADLEDLLMSCLAKKPDGRPASAETLEAALAKCAAATAWDREQAGEWWRKRAAAMTAKTVVMARAPGNAA
jgi:eukaryotic-like serine/threonine-protein kinase